MIVRILPLLAATFLVAGCASLPGTGGGITGTYSNQPGGQPRFRITQGLGRPEMSVSDGTRWLKARPMERLSTEAPEIKAIPWIANIIEGAWSIDGFTFIKFKSGAKVGNETLPTSYFLAPGGFAYRVQAQGPQARQAPAAN